MKNGTRVELHPGCDRWMMGDRFGVVVGQRKHRDLEVTWTTYRVKLDKSGRTIRFHEANVVEV